MRVRLNRENRNAPGGIDPADPTHDPSPLLTLRAAFILTVAASIAAAAGTLTYLATGSPPVAVLAAGPWFAGAIALLNTIIG
jgi:hypothetical protein